MCVLSDKISSSSSLSCPERDKRGGVGVVCCSGEKTIQKAKRHHIRSISNRGSVSMESFILGPFPCV